MLLYVVLSWAFYVLLSFAELVEVFCQCQLYQEIKNVILYVTRQEQEVLL